jgi:hypothetical protein
MYQLGRMTRRVYDRAAKLSRVARQHLRDACRKPRTDPTRPDVLTLRIIVDIGCGDTRTMTAKVVLAAPDNH